ncbi:MAG: peptidoglycan DD-metalloendopeptidase family protein [Bacteroidetes bacterium]|nr:peptidoglycan DD-metalloendopeptidase family protein [Bacteroidota bacterium]
MSGKGFKPLVLLALVITSVWDTYAQNRTQLESKRKKVQQEIEFTRGILKKTAAKKTAALHKLGAINQIIGQRKQVIDNIRDEIQETDSEIVARNSTLTALKNDYRREKLRMRKTVLQAYKTRRQANTLAFVIASSSFRQAIRRLKYLKKLADYRDFLIGQIRERASKVSQGLAALESVKNEKQELLTDNEREKQELEKDKNDKSNLVNSLAGQETELKRKIRENEQAVARLNATISNLIAQEIAEARRKAKAQAKVAAKPAVRSGGNKASPAPASPRSPAVTLTPEARTLSNQFSGNRGSLPWPVDRGYISQSFGVHPHPDLAGITLINNGVDITTSEGSNAHAVFAGTVSAIFTIPGQEKAILINHGEYYTVYSRLSEVYVSRGSEVTAKQNLGKVWTDDDNKTILQFQVWQGQAKQNPAAWLAPR